MKLLFAVLQIVVVCKLPLRTTAAFHLSDESEHALADWERLGRGVNYRQVLALADSVRSGVERGDGEAIERLLAIAKSKDQAIGSRSIAVSVACDIADAAGAMRIFEDMESYLNVHKAREEPSGRPPQQLAEAHALLVRGFVANDAEKLVEALEDDRVALDFLKRFFLNMGAPGPDLSECWRLIRQCNVSPDVARAIALEIIDSRRRSVTVAEQVVDLLDDRALPELRERVRSEASPDSFHFSATEALAHLGDIEILPDLEARRAAFANENAELVKHYNAYFDDWIWRIQIQSPPTRLLDYIGTVAPDPPARREHTWALGRAVKRGMDPGEIRAAILRNHAQAHSTYERLMVQKLKAEGFRLGVLRPGDLADVEAPESPPTQ